MKLTDIEKDPDDKPKIIIIGLDSNIEYLHFIENDLRPNIIIIDTNKDTQSGLNNYEHSDPTSFNNKLNINKFIKPITLNAYQAPITRKERRKLERKNKK